ncbi:helix-turn-helix domain-containing protein [Nocardia farcinica]|uniref:helix-turn-helix domain-containing protein n=1 Tax=Nocardia farcinica TaxID=37329 RepID=UPI0024558568|nr:helix-turn-helix transcriptional regulator [Nocardia farcinica]
MAPSSPTVARWELAVRFKQRLDELSIKVPALCKAIGFTPAYWSHVVTGRSVLSEEKMHKLIEHLDFPADQRAELLALRAEAKEPGWWNKRTSYVVSFL